jgi:hypothetical protein
MKRAIEHRSLPQLRRREGSNEAKEVVCLVIRAASQGNKLLQRLLHALHLQGDASVGVGVV